MFVTPNASVNFRIGNQNQKKTMEHQKAARSGQILKPKH
jgi:hypothetical protein